MSSDLALVNYLADSQSLNIDTSQARRFIVERRVVVDGAIVDDPSFRIPSDKKVSIIVLPNTTKESR